jgi:hypothetical protein
MGTKRAASNRGDDELKRSPRWRAPEAGRSVDARKCMVRSAVGRGARKGETLSTPAVDQQKRGRHGYARVAMHAHDDSG